ncbi:Uncharacterized protein SCF082_LOCUS38498 [Durusdinium trenchii]|uniref:TIR domain-containing protein n=1 Tax=Durusdinium trenchii TaxID=1381693 RepID=A0ABP0PZ96_9DINO
MDLTNRKFLRAVPIHRVLRRFGRVLRTSTQVEFKHSLVVEEIAKFISHSWQASRWSKTLTLLLFYNWKAAVIVSNLMALLAMILFMFDLLPGFRKAARWGSEPLFVAPWTVCTAVLCFVLVLIFRAPKEPVFLDRLCINQRDEHEKAEGVLNIGACLKRSRKLLVIWESTYCQRLWCIFELAAFLKTHEDKDVVVLPTSLAQFVIASIIWNFLMWGFYVVLPFGSQVTTYILLFGYCAYGWLLSTVAVHHVLSVEKMQEELRNFSVADAKCYCCSVNHKDPSGEDIPCDRHVMVQCVQQWFGSIEEFEMSVRSRLKDALSYSLGMFCPYSLVVTSALPCMWVNFDFAAARLYRRDPFGAIGMSIIGLISVFLLAPAGVALIILVIRFSSRCCLIFRKLLAVGVVLVANVAVHGILQVSVDYAGEMWGPALCVPASLLPTFFLWWLTTRNSRGFGTDPQLKAEVPENGMTPSKSI